MEWLTDPNAWIALATLTALEIVLGVDNIIFIAILAGKLPPSQQKRARTLGLFLAMGMRILLLISISWIIGLTKPLFEIFNHDVTGRDAILFIGGLFLLGKSTLEMHSRLEGKEEGGQTAKASSFTSVIVQIMLMDIIFSLDSVITAVGMVDVVGIMIAAVMIAVGIMMFTAGAVSDFVHKHPTVKMLALAFLLLIGMSLVAEGVGHHIPKGYIYFAMGFAVFVEALNLRIRGKDSAPVTLHEPAPGTSQPSSHH